MAETSRAAVITAPNTPLEIRDVPIPKLEPTAMLARVDAATLCGTDIHRWHGVVGNLKMPFIPGHETCGTIVDMNGPRTDLLGVPLKEGDRVLWAYPSCGRCYWCEVARQPSICPEIRYWGCNPSEDFPYLMGGCADYQYVPPRCDVIRVPDSVPDALAAAAACAYRTVMHGFERLGNIHPHETVLVQGCGPLGLFAAAVARDKSAWKVLVSGAPAERLSVAQEMGADDVLNIDEEQDVAKRIDWVKGHTDGRGVDIVIQCATFNAVPEGVKMMRRGGRYVSIGAGGNAAVPVADIFPETTFYGVAIAEPRHWLQAIRFLETRKDIPWAGMISAEYPLEDLTRAFEDMASFKIVKPVVYPHGRQR